jgi:GTPase KRas
MLEILDTAGQEEYTGLREQWIHNGEGFVLVYSVTSRSSFTRIQRLHSQIQRLKESLASSSEYPGCPISSVTPPAAVPIILVGNKSDRATDREVSVHEGQALAQKLGCGFLEASAKNQTAVEDTIYYVVRQLRQLRSRSMLKQTRRKKGWARILKLRWNTPSSRSDVSRMTSRKLNAMSTDTIPSHI